MRRILAFFLLAALGTTVLSGLPLPLETLLPFLDNEAIETLRNTGELTRFHDSEFTPALLPVTAVTPELRRQIDNGTMNLGSEILFLYDPLPPSMQNESTEDRLLRITNILRSLSTLEGIEYFSQSRGKIRVLFTESWCIAGPDDPAVLDDPHIRIYRPGTDRYFIHQKDTSFGTNRSEILYRQETDCMSLSFQNKSALYYFRSIKAVDADQLQMHLLCVPTNEYMLVYGYCAADGPDSGFVKKRAAASFYNRIIALNNWFAASF